MYKYFKLLTIFTAVLGTAAVQAAQVTVCTPANDIKSNPTYYGLVSTRTKLKCEVKPANLRPTLPQLYQSGWRLIQVVGGDNSLARGGKKVVPPLYYLEKVDNAGTKVEKKKKSGTSFWNRGTEDE